MVFISPTICTTFSRSDPKLLLKTSTSIFQDNTVSADLIINREQFEWWTFRDINRSNLSGLCGALTGPMAIIISEETPPRKLVMKLFVSIVHLYNISNIVILLQRAFSVTHSASSAYGGFT